MVEVLNKPGDAPFDAVDQALLILLCRFAGEALATIEESGRQQDMPAPPSFDPE